MAVGTTQTLFICVPAQLAQAPCPAGTAPATMQGYVLDPGHASSIEAQNEPFDYVVASQIWGMSFTFVVMLYLVSKSAGAILSAIRNF
ncbi:MAG: hypothetical protein WKG03_04390 [Telluria sp.]